MSTLHPALSESITKNMSGTEEKQGDRRRSVEGHCTKHSREVGLTEKKRYYDSSFVNWKVSDGDMEGGTGISDNVLRGKG